MPAAVTEALKKIPPPEQTAPITSQALESQEFRSVVYEQSREIIERDKRRQSIVVKGFGTNPSGVQKSFAEMTLSLLNTSVHLADIIVINNEMVRGKIFSEEKRRAVLNCVKDLKSHHLYAHVYINRDLTRQQREAMYTRRQRFQLSQIPWNIPPVNQVPVSVVTGANSIPVDPNCGRITQPPIVSPMQLNIPPPVITTSCLQPNQTRPTSSSLQQTTPSHHRNIPSASNIRSHPPPTIPPTNIISSQHHNLRSTRRSRSTSPTYFPPVGLPVRTHFER